MDEPQRHYVQQKQPDRKTMYQMITFIWTVQKTANQWRQKID